MSSLQGDKPRCAIYCRVARADEEAPGEAIERQRQILLAYAREMGYTETTAYMDNGYSGHDADRPAFAKLNADIAAGRVNVVLMRDYSRIGRDYGRCRQWLARMDKLGVAVLCADAPQREEATPPKHHKKKQRRHTVRTPPPAKTR